MFLLERLFADPPTSPKPTTQADDAAPSPPGTLFARSSLSQLTIAHLSEGSGISDARGSHNPCSADPPARPPTVQIGRDVQPRDLPGRKGVAIPFPEQPWILEQPRLPTFEWNPR